MNDIPDPAAGGNPPIVRATWFDRNDAPIGKPVALPWNDLCAWIAHSPPVALTKDGLPLIKLATFTGNYRSNATIEWCHGIEGDYDAETLQPHDAAALLTKAGVSAFIYTSPSHRPDKPRWRVLCPLPGPMPPTARNGLVSKLNGILGGVLAPESFTLSQPFYVGSVTGGEPVRCWRIEGRSIDIVEGLEPIGPRERENGTDRQRKPLGSMGAAPTFDVIMKALYSIDPNKLDYHKWRNMSAAYRQAATGKVADFAIKLMWDGWCGGHKNNVKTDNDKLWRSLENGTELGWEYLRDHASLEFRSGYMFGRHEHSTTSPVPAPRTPDVWQTFNSDDAAKASAIICVKNITECGWPFAHDDFSDRIMITGKVPWDKNTNYPRPYNDYDTHGCKIVLEALSTRPSKETVHDSIKFVASKNPYHPVRSYLNSIVWDGVVRIDKILPRYFGADDTPYSRTIGGKFLISAVARVMQPGCKADTMIILEGAQGAGKSSALRALVGDDWFTDQMPDISTKDAEIQLSGKWLIEIAELDRMSRAEVTAVKSYASRQIGTYRPPYGRVTIDVPRQCVFAGSTNETEYLRDQTGNRRFWPVACGVIDVGAIRRDRDQLWAEAFLRYNNGETWWLDGAEQNFAQLEQDDRRERDPWEALIATKLAPYGAAPITIDYICKFILDIPFEKHNATKNKRVANCLKHAGYKRERKRQGADRVYHYVKN